MPHLQVSFWRPPLPSHKLESWGGQILVPLEFCLTGLCFLIHSKQNFPCAPLPTYRPLKFFHTGNQCFNPFPYSTAMSWHLSTFRTFFCSLLLFSLPNVGFLWSHLPCFVSEAEKCPAFLSLACQFPQPLLVHRAFHAWRICLIVK